MELCTKSSSNRSLSFHFLIIFSRDFTRKLQLHMIKPIFLASNGINQTWPMVKTLATPPTDSLLTGRRQN